jgi:hypothetical protein
VFKNPESVKTIQSSDVCEAFEEMMKNRKSKMADGERMKRRILAEALYQHQQKTSDSGK